MDAKKCQFLHAQFRKNILIKDEVYAESNVNEMEISHKRGG
jgi:hypothetical protein